MNTWIAKVGAVLLLQLALVGVAVGPQLSARVTGDDYLLRVEPVDPIDPFRGAYVALGYPDLPLADESRVTEGTDGERGTVFVGLVEQDGVWVGESRTRTRPDDGPYLTCDDHGWRLACGIESYFLPQDEAAAFEQLVADGGAVARVRIDSRGHASVVAVEEG